MKRIVVLIGILSAILMLYISCANAEGGTYCGVDWEITDSGELIIGQEGATQTFTNGFSTSWPWLGKTFTSVRFVGSVVADKTLANMFNGCAALVSVNFSGLNTSTVQSMSHLCMQCNALESANVEELDVHSVTNFSYMFYGCKQVGALDVSDWDVSSATDLSLMFACCETITSLDVADWDISHVTTLLGTFSFCYNLADLDVSGWDTSNVTILGRESTMSLFTNDKKLTSLDLSGWDTSKVTNMNGVFSGCLGLVSLDVSTWNTSLVTDMGSLFSSCQSLTSLDVANWDTSAVTNMSSIFSKCESLTAIDITRWDTSQVKYMKWVFGNCSGLRTLDVSNWSFDSAVTYTSMFTGCSNLSEIKLGAQHLFTDDTATRLPDPMLSRDGIDYTGKWIKNDLSAGPYTANELRENYDETMAGTWVWEVAPAEYTINFVASKSDVTGSMPQVQVLSNEDYVLPKNLFASFGYVFDHWDDGNGCEYLDQGIIIGNTYDAGDVITLAAVFVPRNTSVTMQDGEFTFSIKGDEKAVFDDIPVGTSYQVFEENIPEDWVLIMQSDGTGVIYSLTESEAIFLNKYQPDLATIQFTGRKLMDEQPAEADSFTFELWEGNILLQTKSVTEGGFVQFDILEYDKFDEGIHTYTIKELIGTDETLLYDGHEETIQVDVTTTTGDDNVTRVHAEVTYSDGTYPDIVFKNWTKPGHLTLKKLVDDLLEGHEGDEFRFRITFKQENGLPLEDELTYSIEP